ncbi:WD40-repeat-containing domain protein [Fusarium flagelliforme]|uniref:Chromatin assembly factor 1 subunit b n=1 Tax=Fusarium flagelliforme TaxID=2675880 RepID=A0A395N151_9HYPO|nr:WD40-repeat-containing domain protein [Fusarium flagelliforme]KAH7196754.1 WD40-repeat-containing domain protein [Fusarium flagelliforme]RFN53239.1 chromatin assembly factor 1 subunit b [Fusarium flagelliforme]
MKAAPLIINWHDQNAPVYSAHFEPSGKGRLATAGGDNHIRIWKVQVDGEDRKVEYLSTLSKHNQAVNVVRWAPKGELLASAGDDGNVILWVPSETPQTAFGSDAPEDKESWRAKHMCRSSGAEIYDLAWSPDGVHFMIGSMDNIARIYNAQSGTLVRQIAEHSHYVQGVTWDPLNEYIATQSSDRSVHIYSLKTKDGQYTLNAEDKTPRLASHIKADLPPRRISSSSPAPPDFGHRSSLSVLDPPPSIGSPVPSAPGTPTSFALPMNPPSVVSHSRRSSFSSRRSVSPAPSMPLPAVMPMDPSPKPSSAMSSGLGMKNANLYANETLTSFFRRLTFTPDGSLLLTPSGQYQNQHLSERDAKPTYEVINTVYIYTRGGINKPPIAHLPGHKKPSVVVKCSPIYYTLRQSPPVTRNITIDTSSSEEPIPSLPEPLSKPSPAPSVMDPPPPPSSTSESKTSSSDAASSTPGPKPAFSLPYRMVYAVATQDSVLLYDTQQKTPICVVSNLHCATFTDLAWSSDGLTLMISSSDGFCSTLSFTAGELGEVYKGEVGPPKTQTAASSNQSTPMPTPTNAFAPPSPFPNGSHHQHRNSASSFTAPSPPQSTSVASQRPSSPTRSNSTSSVATVTTQASTVPAAGVVTNPTLISGNVPGIAAANSGKVTGVPLTTPPETPRSATASVAGNKRDASDGEKEENKEPKKRRIAPTLVEPKN